MARRTATRALSAPSPAEIEVTLPHLYNPRSYQRPMFMAMQGGCRRAITVWHRRAGKDLTWLSFTIGEMVEAPGTYFLIYPTYAQGKKAIWDGKDSAGIPFLSRFPDALVVSKNETEMQVTLRVGVDEATGQEITSVFQILGADKPDSLRGTNPRGVVFSEYAVMDDGKTLWDIVRPILNENGGWAGFAYTPSGENHGWELLQAARAVNEAARAAGRPEPWFVQLLTVDDTKRDAPGEDGSPVVTEDMIAQDRAEGMPEELIAQEYRVSFTGSREGSYYSEPLNEAERTERIGLFPYDPRFPVQTAWDIGHDDLTAIWFVQVNGPSVRLIDYYEARNEGVLHFVRHLKEQKPYLYGRHYGPHDLEVTEWGSSKTRLEIARGFGIRFTVVPKWSVAEGIDAVRRLFPRLAFDRLTCKAGLAHLRHYRRLWDPRRRAYADQPFHDVHSNAADALRYLAVGLREQRPEGATLAQAQVAFNPYTYDQRQAVTEFNPLMDVAPEPEASGWWAIEQARRAR